MIKKITGFLMLALFAAHVIAQQTKEETEGWILKQTVINTPGLSYTIEGDEFVSRMSYGAPVGLGVDDIQKAIPISKITQIQYIHTDRYLSYIFMCNELCAYLLAEPEEKQPKFLFEIYRKLDASFAERMNKALLHLIKLHGGNAKISKQAQVKEAF